ncbi:MAG TPA: prephenate dehydrogenase [Actinokineospora sp.]|nr:prephenate dehydrogenase [Actinokineospora sp.]
MRSVCVIGLGLIGGSVLRAAVGAGRTAWGATASDTDAEAAAASGFDIVPAADALRRAVADDALVVIAVPLTAIDTVLRQVAEFAPECLLTDVASVKAPVAEAVGRYAPATRYVGGHPMAGTSASGWSASTAELFHGAAWVVTTDVDTDATAWRAAADLAIDCGAHVVPVPAGEHDAAVARISHLPHVLAAILAACGADGGPLAMALAAGSFGDGTRVMGTRPELVLAMCEGNRAALLEAVDDALGRLGAARGALASTGALRATVMAGHDGRASLEAHRATKATRVLVDLEDGDALEELSVIGADGGRVIGFDGTMAVAEVPTAD